jgi:hypothetical protein
MIPIQSILGNLPVVPVGNTGTIPHNLGNVFPGEPGDLQPIPAMNAGRGLSTRGHWDGPGIYNVWEGVRRVIPYGER